MIHLKNLIAEKKVKVITVIKFQLAVACFYHENITGKLAVSETLVMALSLITDK